MKPLTSVLVMCAALALVLAAPAWAGDIFKAADAEALAIRIVSEPAHYDRSMLLPGTVMNVQARCSTLVLRQIDVTLMWDVRLPGAKAFRIDVSELRDGFSKGRFLTSGERPLGEQTIAFDKARGGLYYYWRVLTRTDDGWVVSGAGRFDAPVCRADMADSE